MAEKCCIVLSILGMAISVYLCVWALFLEPMLGLLAVLMFVVHLFGFLNAISKTEVKRGRAKG